MMPLLVSSSSYLSFLFLVITIYFFSHPCIARMSLANKQTVLNKSVLYFSTDSSRAENNPKGIANRSIQDFHKEKNDIKVMFSGSQMIVSDLSPSTLPHSRLLKTAKTKVDATYHQVCSVPQNVWRMKFFGLLDPTNKQKNQLTQYCVSLMQSVSGARWSATHEIHVASQTGNNKNLYGDIIEMDYDPPHRKPPIHN